MRLFIAIDLDERLRKTTRDIENEIESAGADMKMVEPGNLHITLKFLGEVREDMVKDVVKIVSESLKGLAGFRISIGDLGYFGNPGHVRTLWLDVKEGKEKVIELMKLMNNVLGHIMDEKREPVAHITIGRARSGRNREALLEKLREKAHVKLGSMDVKFIKLKMSVLGRDGPVYKDIETVPLQ